MISLSLTFGAAHSGVLGGAQRRGFHFGSSRQDRVGHCVEEGLWRQRCWGGGFKPAANGSKGPMPILIPQDLPILVGPAAHLERVVSSSDVPSIFARSLLVAWRAATGR